MIHSLIISFDPLATAVDAALAGAIMAGDADDTVPMYDLRAAVPAGNPAFAAGPDAMPLVVFGVLSGQYSVDIHRFPSSW
jgi:hypothetical protein